MSMEKSARPKRYFTSFRYNGKKYSVAANSKRELHKKVGQKIAQLEAGTAIKQKAVTVQQYAAEWVSTYHGTESEQDKDYQSIVKNHIVPDLGADLMRDITEIRLQTFLNRKAETLSRSRVSKIKITLGQMFRKARKNRIIADNPADDLYIPSSASSSTRRSLTDQERALLLAVLPDHRGNVYCQLMLYCGLRPGEVNVLTWGDVDLEHRIIHVRNALKHNSSAIGTPKTDAGIRDIPIPQTLLETLSAHPKRFEYVAAWKPGYISRPAQYRMWQSIRREMDILAGATVYRNRIVNSVLAPDLDLYCLRHTYCTDLQKAGVPINIAKELMGHSSIEVTARIYTHTQTDETRKAIRQLDKHIAANPNKITYLKFG